MRPRCRHRGWLLAWGQKNTIPRSSRLGGRSSTSNFTKPGAESNPRQAWICTDRREGSRSKRQAESRNRKMRYAMILLRCGRTRYVGILSASPLLLAFATRAKGSLVGQNRHHRRLLLKSSATRKLAWQVSLLRRPAWRAGWPGRRGLTVSFGLRVEGSLAFMCGWLGCTITSSVVGGCGCSGSCAL